MPVPMRWRIGSLMFLGIAIVYIDRVNISYAIVPIAQELKIGTTDQALVLSAFAWGYVAFMLPGGWLADRFGAHRVCFWSCVGWSILTLLTAVTHTLTGLCVLRFLLGAAAAPLFPSFAKTVRDIFPLQERGRATALFDAGSYVGIIVTSLLVAAVMVTWGWRTLYLMCAVLGLSWGALWYRSYKPVTHSSRSTSDVPSSSARLAVPWINLLTNRKVWGASCGFFCYNYLKSFYLTWLPTYLVAERGMSMLKVGVIGVLPPLAGITGEFFAGFMTDRMLRSGVSVTVARKAPLCVGLVLSSIIMLVGSTESAVVVILLLCVSYASLIAGSPSIWAIPGDIAPNPSMVGFIGGIQNTISNTAGILAPVVTGFLFVRTGSFAIPMMVSGVLTLIGAGSYWWIVGELRPIGIRSAATSPKPAF